MKKSEEEYAHDLVTYYLSIFKYMHHFNDAVKCSIKNVEDTIEALNATKYKTDKEDIYYSNILKILYKKLQ